jgi:hypothetical protein
VGAAQGQDGRAEQEEKATGNQEFAVVMVRWNYMNQGLGFKPLFFQTPHTAVT